MCQCWLCVHICVFSVCVAVPVSSSRWVPGSMTQINHWAETRKRRCYNSLCAATACLHLLIWHLTCWWFNGADFALQQMTLNYSNAQRQSWEVLLNMSTKRPASLRDTEWRRERWNEKGSHCCKGIRVQRHPDTGIPLNKASIVQRKHAYWHKKWQEARNTHTGIEIPAWILTLVQYSVIFSRDWWYGQFQPPSKYALRILLVHFALIMKKVLI